VNNLTTQLARAIAAADAAVGVHQHHDGLTGTDLAAVALNYANMIANASALLAPAAAATAASLAGLGPAGASGCTERNVSVCPATAPLRRRRGVQQSVGVVLVLYNPLAAARTEVVAVPVPTSAVEVLPMADMNSRTGGGGAAAATVEYEVLPSIMADARRGMAWTLFIKVTIKPLALMRLMLRPATEGGQRSAAVVAEEQDLPDVMATRASRGIIDLTSAGGGGPSVAVDAQTGMLLSVDGQPVRCSLAFYTPAVGSNRSHGWGDTDDCSSAYAFRPMPGVPKAAYGPSESPPKVYRGSIVQQSHVVVDEAAGIELAVRVVAGDSSVQLISQLGPLDVSNGYGQEAVMELSAPISSGASWRTDANGLFMMPRVRRTNASGFFPGYVVAEPEAQN
jgi:hypothetical protein